MKKIDVVTRDQIAQLFSSAIDLVVREHSLRLSQEHQITSRLAQAVDHVCNANINDWEVRACFQELPDRGRGALEGKIGADLYIVFEIENGASLIRKGLYVQAKKANDTKSTDKDRKQFETLTYSGGSNGSYIWVYDETGVSVVPAQEAVQSKETKLSELNSKNMNEHIRDVLDCFAGTPKLCPVGLFCEDGKLNAKKLSSYLLEFSIPNGLLLSISNKRS